MQALLIANTIRTAGVNFDADKALLSLKGNSIPENSDQFFQPLHDWVDEFMKTHKGKVTFRIFMTYFNTSTIRHIIGLMKKLIQAFGSELKIEWAYEKGDEEIRDRGQDISEVVKFEFSFEEVPY
ncbi:MAG TPA: DUF1987 domain-containing protein [Bacteroidia bacterium]|nr:DUF1987 domain-containing protein [Bacteroidia bacterium]